MNRYSINKQLSGNAITRTVEADSYKQMDGFFHFYKGFGENAERVFSMDASRVVIVEVIKP